MGRFHEANTRASVLIVDDEPGMRNFLRKTLLGSCARVDVAEHTEDASRQLDANTYDVVVLDNIMPDKTGLDWLAEQREIGLFSDAILITAHADLETAIQAIRAGASDFLLKPFRSNQVLNAIARSLERAKLRRQNTALRYELDLGHDPLRRYDALQGSSSKIEDVRCAIERAAKSDAHVVLQGEVGSGKQVAARMLHARSQRKENPFVWLQCYGLDEQTFQERLFGRLGHPADGAFAGQHGMLFSAAGGTLYLEDVGMLSPACQNILVELLSTGRFTPLGASRSVKLDVRIVCSTAKPLKESAGAEEFRADLFYLLSVIEIVMPPLRERTSDIIELTQLFCSTLAQRRGLDVPMFDGSARRRFLSHDWPGNVMELRNTVERALIHGSFDMSLGPTITDHRIESLAEVEKRHILSALNACNGNRAETARRLGVARKTIDRKCQSWGL